MSHPPPAPPRRPVTTAERIVADMLLAQPLHGFDAAHVRAVHAIAGLAGGALDESQRQAFWRIARRHQRALGISLEELARLEQMRGAA